MTGSVDALKNIRLHLSVDEADVIIAALALYEVTTGRMAGEIKLGGGNIDTSLMFQLFDRFQKLAVTVGKGLLEYRDIAKIGK